MITYSQCKAPAVVALEVVIHVWVDVLEVNSEDYQDRHNNRGHGNDPRVHSAGQPRGPAALARSGNNKAFYGKDLASETCWC
jgi:hypothetical protein